MTVPSLSVVIPLLDAADSLPATLAALDEGRAAGLVSEIVVADGGSRDSGGELAQRLGGRLITAPRGRGPQVAAGAAATTGDWLLFLHADTRLGPGWSAAAARFMQSPKSAQRAAVFRLALDDPDRRARRIERLANWRTRALGLPYGDQGLLLSRDFYEELGGFRPLVLMEDVDIARRIGRRRLVVLESPATTSAARYRRDGWLRRPARNLALLGAYFLGVPPRVLDRFYQ